MPYRIRLSGSSVLIVGAPIFVGKGSVDELTAWLTVSCLLTLLHRRGFNSQPTCRRPEAGAQFVIGNVVGGDKRRVICANALDELADYSVDFGVSYRLSSVTIEIRRAVCVPDF
jgi:hypothetical protein